MFQGHERRLELNYKRLKLEARAGRIRAVVESNTNNSRKHSFQLKNYTLTTLSQKGLVGSAYTDRKFHENLTQHKNLRKPNSTLKYEFLCHL